MKRIPASILTMLGVVIFMTGCDRPGCKNTNPIFDKYSPQTKEYKDELVIYKIDTDKEAELSSLFGIQSIPTLLFIPLNGNPMVQKGALPKNILQQIIEERLLQHVEIKK